MKHNTANRRSRNRGGGKRQGGGRNNYESNGPEGKVRGTAQQVLDKYLVLARDAASAGDRIKSESYFQFAEHYYRIVIADGANNNANRREGQHPQETVSVEGNRSQTVVAPQTITENSEVGTTIGMLSVVDSSDGLTFSVSSGWSPPIKKRFSLLTISCKISKILSYFVV